jgi:hypothetical protein
MGPVDICELSTAELDKSALVVFELFSKNEDS